MATALLMQVIMGEHDLLLSINTEDVHLVVVDLESRRHVQKIIKLTRVREFFRERGVCCDICHARIDEDIQLGSRCKLWLVLLDKLCRVAALRWTAGEGWSWGRRPWCDRGRTRVKRA